MKNSIRLIVCALAIGGGTGCGCDKEPDRPPSIEAKMLIDSMSSGEGWEFLPNRPVRENDRWERRNIIFNWKLKADVCETGYVYQINTDYRELYPFDEKDREYIKEAYKKVIRSIRMRPLVDGATQELKGLANKEQP